MMAMTQSSEQHQKVSSELAARLNRLTGQEMVRAIILLQNPGSNESRSRRPSPEERKASVKAIKQSAGTVLPEIDRILERFEGRRLTDQPDALGSITVVTTANGINALAGSAHVKAILEDQDISLFSN